MAGELNVAVTETLAVKVSVQVPVPVQAPDHPAKVEPEAGVAVRVTLDPVANEALHAVPQLMPVGLLVTVPLPVPARVTLSTGALAFTLKVAMTEVFAVKVTTHEAVPVHAPDHPANVEPEPATAVRVTCDPVLKLALQVVPQLIPAGALVTVPVPVPASETVSVGDVVDALNVALTEIFAFRVTMQEAVPVQAPDHPVNVEPELATAVRVTCEPVLKLALHVVPQVIPEGLLVTVPVPVPVRETLSTGEAAAVVNVAVTEVFAERETSQEAVPLQAPDHPAKVDPEAGVAVSVTEVPLLKSAVQVAPQLIPEGALVMVPAPVPVD